VEKVKNAVAILLRRFADGRTALCWACP